MPRTGSLVEKSESPSTPLTEGARAESGKADHPGWIWLMRGENLFTLGDQRRDAINGLF